MSTLDLRETLRLHKLWLEVNSAGKRADLSDADLRGADLSGADLSGAYLSGADLRGAKIRSLEIRALMVFTGLYDYECWAIVAKDGTPWVRMGCLLKTVDEWDAIGVRNSNTEEFERESSGTSARRARAFYYVRNEALIMAEEYKRESVS